MTDLDLDMADTEEEKRQMGEKKSSYVWRGLRLASKNKLSTFERIEPFGRGLEALQPVPPTIEATGEDIVPTASDDKGIDPHDDHQNVKELRAGDQGQVTAVDTAT